MKRNLFASLLAGVGVSIAIFVNTGKPSLARRTPTFYCEISSEGVPTMFALTELGYREFIRWQGREFPSGVIPIQNCNLAAARFDYAHLKGALKYITYGLMENKGLAICATRFYDSSCEKFLFEVGFGIDPDRILIVLEENLNIDSASGRLITFGNPLPNTIEIAGLHSPSSRGLGYNPPTAYGEPLAASPLETALLYINMTFLRPNTNFVCGSHKEDLATLVLIENERLPLFIWNLEKYPKNRSSPKQICDIVSKLLKRFSKDKKLNYLTLEENKVCIAMQEREECSESLFELESDQNPQEELKKINERVLNIKQCEKQNFCYNHLL